MMVAQETGVKRYTQIGHGFLRWFLGGVARNTAQKSRWGSPDTRTAPSRTGR